MTEPFFAPRFEILISGLTMGADLTRQVISLVIETDLDLAGSFVITLHNADNSLLDSALLDLGKTVEVHIGYGADLDPAFLGEITAIEPEFPQGGPPTVRVVGYDKSYKMRRAQPEPTDYRFMPDSLIAAQIAAENGLIPIVDPTPGFHDKITQVESDMAFLKARARDYFLDVYVEWDRLHFQFPRPQTAAFELEWGKNLSSFSPRISSAGLAGLQIVRGFNQELAQSIFGIALATEFDVDNNFVERLGSSAADLLTSLARRGIRKENIDNPVDAITVAKALLQNLLEGMYEGTGQCVGIPGLTAGKYVSIKGVGKRFSGTYRARKVTHTIDDRGFRTEFNITQRSHSSLMGLLRNQMLEEPAPDRAEQFYGVVVANVIENNELLDVPPRVPLGRVKVSYPGLSETFTSGWAPCARPMAGKDAGFYALPDVGDQVLVAFEHGNLAKPFVLGTLWDVKKQPPATNLDGMNSKRVIKSPSGHTITFDDTPGVGKLVLENAQGSTIALDAADGSITISAATDLVIKANGTIKLEAAAGTTTIEMNATEVNVS